MVERVTGAVSNPQVPGPPPDGGRTATIEDGRQFAGSSFWIHEHPHPTASVLDQPGQLPEDRRVDVAEEPGETHAAVTGQRARDAPGPLFCPGDADRKECPGAHARTGQHPSRPKECGQAHRCPGIAPYAGQNARDG